MTSMDQEMAEWAQNLSPGLCNATVRGSVGELGFGVRSAGSQTSEMQEKKMYLQHGHLRVAALHRAWSATTDITVLEKEMGTNGAPEPSQESLAPSALALRGWQYQTEGLCMKLQAKSSQLHQQTLKHPLLGDLGSVCKIRRLSLFI